MYLAVRRGATRVEVVRRGTARVEVGRRDAARVEVVRRGTARVEVARVEVVRRGTARVDVARVEVERALALRGGMLTVIPTLLHRLLVKFTTSARDVSGFCGVVHGEGGNGLRTSAGEQDA